MINGTMPKTRAGNTGLQRHMAYFQFIHSEFKGGGSQPDLGILSDFAG